MSKLLFPRFKIHRPKQSAFWVLEDIANQGPKYLMMKADLEDLRGQIDNMLGEFKGDEKDNKAIKYVDNVNKRRW